MAINIKIQKKDLWLLVTIMVFLVGVGYVMAYNWATGSGTGLPSIHGHTADEIEGGMGISIIADTQGDGTKTGTQMCTEQGKTCLYVISDTHIADSVGCLGIEMTCIDVCQRAYNQNGLNTPNHGNIWGCDEAKIGSYITYLDSGVLRCNGWFSAICS